jgi:hypothetical protein
MTTPTTIKVGALVYSVKYERRLCNADHQRLRGRHDGETLEISLDTGMTPQRERMTLFHEIFHAVEAERNFNFDENITDQMSFGIVQVLVDNPELVTMFLSDADRQMLEQAKYMRD